eukprot:359887_1
MAEIKEEHKDIIELNGCDDFHIHLRNEENLALLVEHACVQIERGLVMPNTKPPILTVDDATKYRKQILNHVPNHQSFTPLMSLYLTDSTTIHTVQNAAQSDFVYAFKLYPKNATTNSKFGVTNIKSKHIKSVFREMEKWGLILCIHGECNVDDQSNTMIDIFEREHTFIDNELQYILSEFPNLKVILEHVTTKKAVDFIIDYYKDKQNENKLNLAATITAHHLLNNRNHIFEGNKINPHLFCLPILKTESDQNALIQAATSALPYFFGGSDSAPHTKNTKECHHGCAGIYSMYNVISLYAETFDTCNAMDKLNDFLSRFGAEFYGIPRNKTKMKLIKQKHKIPESFKYMDDVLVPFKSGQKLNWCLERQLKYKYVAERQNHQT